MSTTRPAAFAQFGQSLAFAEQTLSAVLAKHLAVRGVETGTWYALKLISSRPPAVPRDQLVAELESLTNARRRERHWGAGPT